MVGRQVVRQVVRQVGLQVVRQCSERVRARHQACAVAGNWRQRLHGLLPECSIGTMLV